MELETLFAGEAATLEMILLSRERRAQEQRALLHAYGAPVVCLLCNIPGPVKRCAAGAEVFAAGAEAVFAALERHGLIQLYARMDCFATGPEGYWCVDAQPIALKRLCCAIEESHPLGRLMDIDVIPPAGVPVSRTSLGLPRRGCLVCGAAAADCVSRQTHSLMEVRRAVAAVLLRARA